MTNRLHKLKSLPNKEEAYKYGFDKGFGVALGLCIGFLKKSQIGHVEEMKLSVLERKARK